ncbi:tetratricopeptide repeat protein [Thalassospira sp. GB04J01]|uniref:tetratricopeptide repeat protein n=1 Tax=Thalassospira sp. GB04J01 TaxID=1485225 RepID=UPI001FCC0121|nr:tetratricopeptide repeat protein [Thalassospira sp. GB04J01]|tara:strand:+ start:108054 stop:108536 length:483 start_codon:yes stop_codon:yes gene_type:complete
MKGTTMTLSGKTPKIIMTVACAMMFASPMAATNALAMGNSTSWGSGDTDLSAVTELVDGGMYDKAIDTIKEMLKDDPENADLFNYLAYSQRKQGDFDSAAQNYERALMIDPEHVGALEYQGELFLKTGKPDMARENLARLEQVCGMSCDEYKELSAKIAN